MHAGTFSLRLTPSARFLAAAAAWTGGLFVVMRLPSVERGLVVPLVGLQGQIAAWYGARPGGLLLTASCSGTDVLALCMGAILAYPVAWRSRLTGAVGGLLCVLGFNTVRIGSLLNSAQSPAFPLLHLQIWPAILTIATIAYLFVWIRIIEAPRLPARAVRFLSVAIGALLLFAMGAPWTMRSTGVSHVSAMLASAASSTLGGVGVSASSAGAVLSVNRQEFLVTPECVLTPLIPLYLAAAVAWPRRRLTQAGLLAATVPVFAALALARLLVIALPPALVGSPLFLLHGFFQLAIVLPLAAAFARGRLAPAAMASAAGALAAVLGGSAYADVLVRVSAATAPVFPHALATLAVDNQGALRLLPAYQLALLLTLWVAAFGWTRLRTGLLAAAAIAASQLAVLIALGESQAHAALQPHALAVRAWAVVIPVLVVGSVAAAERSPFLRHRRSGRYRRFWHDVGESFPDLGGAASTAYYLANEQRLIEEHLAPLAGRKVLKTDLWDEAKNTRILEWAHRHGARVFGIDISAPIARQAREAFPHGGLGAVVADARALPFRDGALDGIYSMGTIEHFAESDAAVREMHRVLAPGGRAIVGVPNRWDPFLRPAMVVVLSAFGLYSYGYERSFSRRALRQMLEEAGFRVSAETAILFVPGWLRILDLACSTWCPPLARITALALRPFVALDRDVPAVRRHGYLLASVGVRDR